MKLIFSESFFCVTLDIERIDLLLLRKGLKTKLKRVPKRRGKKSDNKLSKFSPSTTEIKKRQIQKASQRKSRLKKVINSSVLLSILGTLYVLNTSTFIKGRSYN